MKKLFMIATLFSVVLMSVTNVSADSIAISNASFEEPSFAGAGNNWSDDNPFWNNPDPIGDQFIELTQDAFTGAVTGQHLANHIGIQNESWVEQDLSTNFVANTTYRLDVSHGNRASQAATTAALFQIRDIAGNILANGTADSSLLAANTFGEASVSFTTGALAPTGAIRIRLGVGTAATRAHFDNIRLDGTLSAIPEPASAVLIGLGAVGMLVRRRRS